MCDIVHLYDKKYVVDRFVNATPDLWKVDFIKSECLSCVIMSLAFQHAEKKAKFQRIGESKFYK